MHQPQLRESVKLYTAMSVQSSLRVCATGGNTSDTIAVIRCSSMFNMRNVIVTRESLWRLCEYGTTSADRYIDDQVSVTIQSYNTKLYIDSCYRELMHCWAY